MSQAIQFLSKSLLPVAAATVTGFPQVVPPLVDRLTTVATDSGYVASRAHARAIDSEVRAARAPIILRGEIRWAPVMQSVGGGWY